MHVGQNTVVFKVDQLSCLGEDYFDEQGQVAVLASAVSGSMDVVRPSEIELLERIRSGQPLDTADQERVEVLLERGYVYPDQESEDAEYSSLIEEYFRTIEEAPFQFMFIPSFVCDLACSYCFEGELTAKSPRMSDEMIDAAFDVMPFIQEAHENCGRPYVTLFGGEPLLDTAYQRRAVEDILKRSYDRGYPTTVITNGVSLGKYVPMLSQYECEEIQVSLDGPPEVHDKRRVFRGGKPTFHLIERSIDTALEAGLRVLIRVLVDDNTINDLPKFAELAQRKGWLGHEMMTIFYGFTKQTQFLYATPHHPQETRERMVIGDVTMGRQEKFYKMLAENPLVDDMLHPDPARIRSALVEGDRIHPNLQGCSAGTSVVAFDPSGRLYGCPETVGRQHHACGVYFPDFTYDHSYREPWRNRYVDTVEMCKTCNVKLFCGGGGCPIKAWAFSGGDFSTCFCPKVESVKTQVERELTYLLPRVLSGKVAASQTQGEETEWQRMKRMGSFPWMS